MTFPYFDLPHPAGEEQYVDFSFKTNFCEEESLFVRANILSERKVHV